MRIAITRAISAPNRPTTGGGTPAPVNTVLPVISGTTRVGSQLSTTNGTWNNSPSGYTYQWQRDGTNIGSATANTYTLVSADFGAVITCEVTASNAGGATMAETTGTAAIQWTALSSVGTIFSEDFSGTLGNYTIQTGTGTISLSGGALQLSGGNGLFTNYIYRSAGNHAITCLEKWRQEVTFVCPTVDASSHGFSVGVVSDHTDQASRVDNANWIQLSGAGNTTGRFTRFCNVGRSATGSGGTTNQAANGGSAGLLTGGNTYTLVVTRNKNNIAFELYNGVGTGGSTVRTGFNTDFNITSITTTSIAPNTGKFAIWNHGGTFSITRWIVDSVENRNPDLVCVGDSNMYGMYAATNGARYCEQAAATRSFSLAVLAGGADTTAQAYSRRNEIIALNPRIVYLNTISNDVALSQSYTTNYSNLVTALKNAGIRVVHGTPIARDAFDMTSVKTYIDTTYSADTRVDLFTTTKNPGDTLLNNTYDIGDNVHLNVAGNNVCDDPLASALNGL